MSDIFCTKCGRSDFVYSCKNCDDRKQPDGALDKFCGIPMDDVTVKKRLALYGYYKSQPAPAKGVSFIDDIIDANMVDEVMTIDVKTVSDVKDFFNQHLEKVRKEIHAALSGGKNVSKT